MENTEGSLRLTYPQSAIGSQQPNNERAHRQLPYPTTGRYPTHPPARPRAGSKHDTLMAFMGGGFCVQVNNVPTGSSDFS